MTSTLILKAKNESLAGWCANIQRSPGSKLKLICFPYAGGSSVTYHNWISSLPAGISIYPVQLPGHGGRWLEAAITSMPDLVDRVLEGLAPLLEGRFAFFGHSMGALIAFEMAHRLAASNREGPEKLYVSGRKAPHYTDDEKLAYLMPADDFVKRLRELNGTPPAVLDDPELLALVLPVIRADFQLIQTYVYKARKKLLCPIHAFGGESDSHVTKSELDGWAMHTFASFSAEMLPGDHFFIANQKQVFLDGLSHDLEELLKNNVVQSQKTETSTV